jgi:hypothetical protein
MEMGVHGVLITADWPFNDSASRCDLHMQHSNTTYHISPIAMHKMWQKPGQQHQTHSQYCKTHATRYMCHHLVVALPIAWQVHADGVLITASSKLSAIH